MSENLGRNTQAQEGLSQCLSRYEAIDYEIIRLLGMRRAVSIQVAEHKAVLGKSAYDETQHNHVLNDRVGRMVEIGCDETMAKRLFGLVLSDSVEIQMPLLQTEVNNTQHDAPPVTSPIIITQGSSDRTTGDDWSRALSAGPDHVRFVVE
ncbi:MAG TPA: chorismate mutase [Candidatus Saccharibacteria bacterium]|jgi:chorismate mutase|nr:chorismate mutase [Candidatus Saccharibacteria bacterium]HMT55678.1 chorismate mutase [Candidatus Saccharibacteria bacterium]